MHLHGLHFVRHVGICNLYQTSATDVRCHYAQFSEKNEVSILTLWTPEDGIPTLRKLPYAAELRYTVQTARYHTRRKTVYLRYGA